MNKLLLTHAMGNQNVRQALRAFTDADLLLEYRTCIARGEDSMWDKVLPHSVRHEMKRRSYDGDILSRTVRKPLREMGRLSAAKVGRHRLTAHEIGRFSTDAVIRGLDRSVAKSLPKSKASAVYAYEDGAYELFKAAGGKHRLYELPIGYWRTARKLLGEEAELQPEWAATLDGLKDSEEKLKRKDEELRLASAVIVPSPFVAKTLLDYPGQLPEVHVIPYGCPEPSSREPNSRTDSDQLKAMFVGSLTARKGLPYLLQGVEQSGASLTLVGSRPKAVCPPLDTALKTHRYLGSLPRARVLEEMANHDVFVFPTLFEGLALSLLEALSCGLVPITTANSGAEGIIRDGVNGFIVPIRSGEAIAERLEELRQDRSLLQSMKVAALETARQHSWAKYRKRLVVTVKPILEKSA